MNYTNTIKKAAGASNTNGLHTDIINSNFRTAGVIEQVHDGKSIATQLAHLALAGHVVHCGDMGDFTVCKCGMTRYCKDFAELQAFARQLGVK